MNAPNTDRLFAGSIPQLYEQLMVPMIFEPYASDLAARVAACTPVSVLELAAGTGVVTRQLARALPPTTTIVATDLNQPMLDQAAANGTSRTVEWRQADAMQLPFPDAQFDVVVCQFGVMFFPDKGKAFGEARRVLRPGGRFIFNVWDRIDTSEFADCVTAALAELFPDDPPRFMARIPHGYFDQATITADLARGGFTQPPAFSALTARSHAQSAQVAALAYCQATPLRNELESRIDLSQATAAATAALTARFGSGPVEGSILAHIVSVQR